MNSYRNESAPALEVGRYVLGELIGEGSMAWVYRAYDPLADRDVAIKALKPSAREHAAGSARVRFIREAEAAGRLAHPHIVTIFDVTADLIVMELLEGENLEERLLRDKRLSFDAVLSILHPLSAALDYAHDRGIVHRDVKPGNIMISPGGRPTLTDFGVAHLGSARITAVGEFLGSPAYMAPEQIDGAPASPRADVFSLAAVVYEMVTGTKAFAGPSVPAAVRSVLFSMPTPPSRLCPEVPASLDAALRRGLAKRPEDRFARCGELAAAIDSVGFERALARINRGEVWSEPERATSTTSRALLAGAAGRTDDAETHDLRLASPAGSARAVRGRRVRRALAGATAAVALAAASTLRSPLPADHGRAETAPDSRPALHLESDPPGASVWIDDRPVGQCPLNRLPLTPGPHTLVVDRPGFATARLRLEPRREGTTVVRFSLHPRMARAVPAAGITYGITRPQGEIETTKAAMPGPRRVAGDTPLYPPQAVNERLQGTVVVEMTIASTGDVDDLRVAESAGDVLDGAVLSAVRTWRFSPALPGVSSRGLRWQVYQRFSL